MNGTAPGIRTVGESDGLPIHEVTLAAEGAAARVLSFGTALRDLCVPAPFRPVANI